MIETEELTHRYKDTLAVDRLDLRIAAGETFGFIGPNGAGKTTTIHILATLLRPTSGRVVIAGHVLDREPRDIRRLIGYMPDAPAIHDDLTVREHLEFFAAAYDIGGARRARVVDDVVALTELGGKADAVVGTLSRGTQQRLGLARVLLHDPQVLLLDEPASGLDPRARVEIREILKELRRLGKTILISSHILADLAEICTSVGILEKGRLVACGTVEAVTRVARRGRVVRVAVEGRGSEAETLLRAAPGVTGVVAVNGHLRVSLDVGGPAELASLLVGNGFRLTHLEEAAGLEEAFMALTQGIVS